MAEGAHQFRSPRINVQAGVAPGGGHQPALLVVHGGSGQVRLRERPDDDLLQQGFVADQQAVLAFAGQSGGDGLSALAQGVLGGLLHLAVVKIHQ